jgi:uncharacterized protein YqfA (UPF0365 family)
MNLLPVAAISAPTIGLIVIVGLFAIVFGILVWLYGPLWFRAYMCRARVSFLSLIGMSLRGVDAKEIVECKIMAVQAGLGRERETGITTGRLEGLYLAGGNVRRVIQAVIAAKRAGISLDFDRAAAIELAGRDVLEAVRTSVHPKVIDCPAQKPGEPEFLSAIAKDGIELRVRARVTVRTNVNRLIGGATEETIIARVGEESLQQLARRKTIRKSLKIPTISPRLCSARGWIRRRPLRLSPSILPISTWEKILGPDSANSRPKRKCRSPKPGQNASGL